MEDSLKVFETLCQNDALKNTPIALLFNKKDLFQAKLSRSPMEKYFPDYDGKFC